MGLAPDYFALSFLGCFGFFGVFAFLSIRLSSERA
jgi:hypothetical protein